MSSIRPQGRSLLWAAVFAEMPRRFDLVGSTAAAVVWLPDFSCVCFLFSSKRLQLLSADDLLFCVVEVAALFCFVATHGHLLLSLFCCCRC